MFNILKLLFVIPYLLFRVLFLKKKSKKSKKPVIAFFHPYCNDGGGGERVLWSLVRVVQNRFKDKYAYHVFHGDDAVSSNDILKRTKDRFGIVLPGEVEFIVLKRRHWVESQLYPVLTMFGQALGSVALGLDALLQAEGDVYCMFDTMGYPFAYPIFHYVGGCKVCCYTHYPVISTDMLERVIQRRPSYNNDSVISQSATLSLAKSWYYRVFAKCYGVVGRYASLVFVNSNWTAQHIRSIWKSKVHVLYPGVNTENVKDFPLDGREDRVISVSQFRPEKDHILQVKSFKAFLSLWKQKNGDSCVPPKLVMIGSVRNTDDEHVVASIRQAAQDVGMKEGRDYDFAFNVSYGDLLTYLKSSKVGLHTMWNEHFGIGVVELMAAGAITIAHNSGGPKVDIIGDSSSIGFLASSVEEYADAMLQAFTMSDKQRLQMLTGARKAMTKFSEQSFERTAIPLVEQIEN